MFLTHFCCMQPSERESVISFLETVHLLCTLYTLTKQKKKSVKKTQKTKSCDVASVIFFIFAC